MSGVYSRTYTLKRRRGRFCYPDNAVDVYPKKIQGFPWEKHWTMCGEKQKHHELLGNAKSEEAANCLACIAIGRRHG